MKPEQLMTLGGLGLVGGAVGGIACAVWLSENRMSCAAGAIGAAFGARGMADTCNAVVMGQYAGIVVAIVGAALLVAGIVRKGK